MFFFDIYDVGDIILVMQIDMIICVGDSFEVGSLFYMEIGFYVDIIILFFGCDSIINMNFIVLEFILVNVE